MKKVNISELILDYTLYPRTKVDSQHVSYMVESLRAGVALPPVIIDEKSKRIIDGFHRISAHKRYFNDDEKIMVIMKRYNSDQEMFLDAMRYNASHGRSLTSYDKAHCVLRSEELNIDPEVVASALNLTTEKIGELRTERIGELKTVVPSSGGKRRKTATGKRGKLFPLKRTIEHKAGTILNEDQMAANDKLSGANQSFYVNQIILLIENDLLDTENEKLMTRLDYLGGLLSNIFCGKKIASK